MLHGEAGSIEGFCQTQIEHRTTVDVDVLERLFVDVGYINTLTCQTVGPLSPAITIIETQVASSCGRSGLWVHRETGSIGPRQQLT